MKKIRTVPLKEYRTLLMQLMRALGKPGKLTAEVVSFLFTKKEIIKVMNYLVKYPECTEDQIMELVGKIREDTLPYEKGYMNKNRLNRIINSLNKINELVEDSFDYVGIIPELSKIEKDISEILEQEMDAYDSMPDHVQSSIQGNKSQKIIDLLDEATVLFYDIDNCYRDNEIIEEDLVEIVKILNEVVNTAFKENLNRIERIEGNSTSVRFILQMSI